MAVTQNLKKTVIFTTTFNSYTGTAIIGEGGSGRIYKATDEDGGVFAVKWLVSDRITAEKVKRFKNELNFSQNNQHPNILTVSDHGVIINGAKGTPFYVMPLFNGSLRDLLKSRIPIDKILGYFSQILDGVEAAHMKGVFHRDLKPENILFSANEDRLIIADFGIAHFEEDDLYTAVETKDTTRLANFQYAAPEQRSRGSEQDHCTDIYALGLLLNEMFTGEIPSGTGYKTIAKAAPEYEYLDAIVEEMIRQSPQDRPSSIEKIKIELIGHREEFIIRQRVSELKGTVVPITDLDDLLVNDPIRLIDADWNKGILTLIFQHPVNQGWINALNNMGGYESLLGKEPAAFSFSGNRAVIGAQEQDVQRIIDLFSRWIPKANAIYKRDMLRAKEQEEEKKRKEHERHVEEEEARQRVRASIKIPEN